MAGFNVFGPVYIDGVPVKISDSFRPPPKVTLPPKFEIGNPTEVLFLDYDFSLEERVVAWTDERERRLKEEQEKERLAAEAAEVEAKTLLEESEAKTSSKSKDVQENHLAESEECVEPCFPGGSLEVGESKESEMIDIKDKIVQYSNASEASATSSSQGLVAAPFVPVNQPFYIGASTGILQPLPAVKADGHLNTHRRNSSFDPKDFETELDPFDRLELKTLDDMKELDQVLQNVHISVESKNFVKDKAPQQLNGSGSQAKGTQLEADNCLTGSVLQEPKHSGSVPPKDHCFPNNSDAMPQNSAVIGINTQSNLVSYKPGPVEYMNSNTSHMNHQTQDIPVSSCNTFIQPPPPTKTGVNSFPSSVSYNNVSSATYGALSNGQTATGSASLTSSNSVYSNSSTILNNKAPQSHQIVSTNHQPVNNMNQYEIWREFLQKNSNGTNISSSHNPSMDGVLYSTSNTFPNGYVNVTYQNRDTINTSGSKSQANSRSHTPTLPETPRLRGAKSTPDLASLENTPNKELPVKTTVNTTSPSASVLKTRTTATTVKTCDNFVAKSETSQKNVLSTGVTDPYRQLPRDDQRFVDSITNMGFKRAIVSKAVQRIGRDEKQVLDFLCGMTRLKDKGFSESEVEEVLILLQNDHKKAQSFLALSKRFQEFGFDDGKVKEGLLNCDLDEEKTLDWLTTQ